MATEKVVVEETVTKVTRTSRRSQSRERTSRRSTERRSVSRSPGRSPSRRKALNRSPSPHRYNTRYKSAFEEEGETTQASACSTAKVGCCFSILLECGCSTFKSITSMLPELIKCFIYMLIAYVAVTQSSYGNSRVQLPKVPKMADLFDEKVFYTNVLQFIITAIAFTIPVGKVVQGVPTDSGVLSYLCNGKAATAFLVAVGAGVYYLDPKSVDMLLKADDVKNVFSGLLIVVILAEIDNWNYGLCKIYSSVAGVFVVRFVDARWSVFGQPDSFYTSVVLVGAMVLISVVLLEALFKGPSSCTATAASRGLLILATTWFFARDFYPLPKRECLLNTSYLAAILSVVLICVYFIYKRPETARACSAMIVITGITAGILINKGHVKIPEKLPRESLWYVCSVGCALDALTVLSMSGWKTNFFGDFKLLDFIGKTLRGNGNPRCDNFDLKFFCLRVGYVCPMLYAVALFVLRYSELSCAAKTVLVMVAVYGTVRAFVLEEVITSSSAEKGGFAPYLETAMGLLYVAGIVLYTATSLQGHFLLLGQDHKINVCLTTLETDGDEKLPISGLWRYIRYPFITGELMVLTAIAFSARACCMGTGMVFLPVVVRLLYALYQISTYHKISPSFYGAKAWKDYQQIVKYNIIPGIY